MYRMTYNNKGIKGCSARGVARRETIEELQELAEQLKETICNVEIKPCDPPATQPPHYGKQNDKT
ncbi:MAG: hypothetical protein JXK04_01005 [Campylobacterales bacterium]|nr:hypothetical protein [Campylobacterales bacterium]